MAVRLGVGVLFDGIAAMEHTSECFEAVNGRNNEIYYSSCRYSKSIDCTLSQLGFPHLTPTFNHFRFCSLLLQPWHCEPCVSRSSNPNHPTGGSRVEWRDNRPPLEPLTHPGPTPLPHTVSHPRSSKPVSPTSSHSQLAHRMEKKTGKKKCDDHRGLKSTSETELNPQRDAFAGVYAPKTTVPTAPPVPTSPRCPTMLSCTNTCLS